MPGPPPPGPTAATAATDSSSRYGRSWSWHAAAGGVPTLGPRGLEDDLPVSSAAPGVPTLGPRGYRDEDLPVSALPPPAQQQQAQQQAQAHQHTRRLHDFSSGSGINSVQPTTPVVLLVLWIIAVVGYLVGFVSGPNVAEASEFRRAILGLDEPEYRRKATSGGHQYCFDDSKQISTLLAVKYLTGCLATLPAGYIMRVRGRRVAIWLGCALFVIAHMLRGAAVGWEMFLAGQVFDGISSAFLFQSPYIEGVEVAPQDRRGAFVYTDHIGRSIGVWSRSLLQEGLAMQPSSPGWGWRLTVLFPVWPALVALLLVPLIPETPNSLMQRGQMAAARAALQEIRGPLVSVEEEFQGILAAAGMRDGHSVSPFAQLRLMLQPDQLPPLLLILVMTVIREFTGGDFILLYVGPLLAGLGLAGSNGSFAFDQAVNAAYFVAAILGFILSDTLGRRPVLIMSSLGGAAFFAALGGVLAAADAIPGPVPPTLASWVKIFIIAAYASFAFGWAGGYWLLVAESFPLATRSLATSVFVACTFGLYSFSATVGVDYTCTLRYNTFFAFTGANLVAAAVVFLLLPESSNVPLEDICELYHTHWLWRHFSRTSSGCGSGGGRRLRKQQGKQQQQQREQQQQEQQQQGGLKQQPLGRGTARGPSVARLRHASAPAAPQLSSVVAAAGSGERASSSSGLLEPQRQQQEQQPSSSQQQQQQQQQWGLPLGERGSMGHTVSASLDLGAFRYGGPGASSWRRGSGPGGGGGDGSSGGGGDASRG